MSSFMTTSRICATFFVLIKLHILLLGFSKAESETIPIPSISSSVSNHICNQQSEFQETGKIQPPLKTRPENDDSKCGWYLWSKCTDQNTEICPSFVLKSCDEAGKASKKGKGILQNETPRKPPKDECDEIPAEEYGLPNPQIVSSTSKYPSVVTIETGDGCRAKYCTGLILNQNWIIVQQTGCFYMYQKDHSDFYEVVAGEGKMYVEEGTEQRRSVAEYIPHPGANVDKRNYYKDNIGLVRLSEPLELNENVQPIDLATIEAIAPSIPNSVLTIVGWLKAQPMKEDEETLASLIESPLDFFPLEICYDTRMEQDKVSNDSLFCAGKCVLKGDDKKKQPLRNILYSQETPESVPVPVGLGPVSHGGFQSVHGVFMNIAAYIPWIKETSEGQSQSSSQGQGQGQGQSMQNPDLDYDSELEWGSRIIRGEDAPPYKYKSMVNLERYRSFACTRHACGGSILNEEWLLTAAHCVDGDEPSDVRIIVGDHDISDNDENEQIVSVSKIIVHENYSFTTYWNDIAVIKVKPPFTFNDKVQKVTLPDASFEETGPFTAIGWGSTENDFIRPHILQQVEIPFVPLEECQEYYTDTPKIPGESQLCAANATHGLCKADSGGPLYELDESGDQIVLGIASYVAGTLCNVRNRSLIDPDPSRDGVGVDLRVRKFRPVVFTKVAYFIDWIMKNAELGS